MPAHRTWYVARLLWAVPALLLFLTINQIDVARDIQRTLEEGTPAVARIIGFESSDRVDVTLDVVSLSVELPDGQVLEKRRMALPHAVAPLLEGKEELDVRVLPGSDQEIVITTAENQSIGRAQARIAAINAAMAFVGMVLAGFGVFAWNRYLARKGDPAYASSEEASVSP